MEREEAIKEAGIKAVKKVEAENVDFTNTVTDGTIRHGYTGFSASVGFVDSEGDERTLKMYCRVDSDDVAEVENLDELDWDKAISEAEFEII